MVSVQPQPSDQYVQSLARGLSVIKAFDADHASMTLSEIAVQTGLTRATARRFLHTLVEIGYVRTDGKAFALTPHVLELGFSYLSALSLPEIAQPHLDAFSRATGESSSLAVLDGREIVYVARAAAKRVMSVSITVGTRFPAHATSMGRVLLAAEGAGVPEGIDLRAITPASITTREDLEAELARVREQGYALVDQELEIGLRSLALPILDAGAVTVAAINVSVSAGEYSIQRMREELLPRLAGTAQSIEDTMTKAPRTV